jgi:hypothetical protein
LKSEAKPPKGKLETKDPSSWLRVFRDNRLSREDGENTEVTMLNDTDREFKNQEETELATPFIDTEELNKLIKVMLGLLT